MTSRGLDDAGTLARVDRSGMLAAVAGLPAQVAEGWARTRDLTIPAAQRQATSVAVLGMGGSAIAADIVSGVFSDRLRVPLTTVRDYDLPAFVGPQTLVVASSHSGATEETIAALAVALERRCPVMVMATGGPILEVARRAELPHLAFPGGGQPRAALGYSLSLLMGLLERAGMLDVSDAEVAAAVMAGEQAVATCGPEIPTDANPAKRLAWQLLDRLPVVEAPGFLAPVAHRWKTQLNENGKSHAGWEALPEATHNTVVGYAEPVSLRDHLFVVFLEGPDDHPRNALRASTSARLLAEAGIGHHVQPVSGEGRLAQAVHGIVIGDLVSTYLGILYDRDPTPVDAITALKAHLAQAARSGS